MTVNHNLRLDENAILSRHAQEYAAFEEKVCNVPVFSCISCHMLRRREEVVPFPLSDCNGFVGNLMHRLTSYVKENLHATDAMFICRVCKLYVKKDSMPPSCVLNDLHLDPVPQCLS